MNANEVKAAIRMLPERRRYYHDLLCDLIDQMVAGAPDAKFALVQEPGQRTLWISTGCIPGKPETHAAYEYVLRTVLWQKGLYFDEWSPKNPFPDNTGWCHADEIIDDELFGWYRGMYAENKEALYFPDGLAEDGELMIQMWWMNNERTGDPFREQGDWREAKAAIMKEWVK